MTTSNSSAFAVGDRVEVTVTGNVTRADGGWVEVNAASAFWLSDVTVKKVAPPKPEAGDSIPGKRLKDTPWRRGTVIVDSFGTALMLRHDGRWESASGPFATTFSDFTDVEILKVVYVA